MNDTSIRSGSQGTLKMLVRKLDLFSGLDDSALDNLTKVLRVQHYAPDQHLIHEGDYPQKVIIIVEGITLFYRLTPSGRKLVHGIFVNGDSICEIPLLIRENCLISVQAITPVKTVELQWGDYLRFSRKEPSILYELNVLMAKRVRLMQEMILDIFDLDTTQRIEKTLDRLGVIFNSTIPLTHQQIADMCGTSRETVSRSLERLRLEGKIQYSQKSKSARYIKMMRPVFSVLG